MPEPDKISSAAFVASASAAACVTSSCVPSALDTDKFDAVSLRAASTFGTTTCGATSSKIISSAKEISDVPTSRRPRSTALSFSFAVDVVIPFVSDFNVV